MKNHLLVLQAAIVLFATAQLKAQDTAPTKPAKSVREERKPNVLARLIRGPYLQVATSNSIIIRWRTDALTRSMVQYGESENQLEATAEEPSLTFEHKVQLTGLKPQTKYFYSMAVAWAIPYNREAITIL